MNLRFTKSFLLFFLLGVISISSNAQSVCWSPSQNATTENSNNNIGNRTGSFTSNLTGITANNTYHARAYYISSVGTALGKQQSFTTTNSDSVITSNPGAGVTYNGYTYGSVVLGNGQEWMSENLRTANYRNGDPIPTGLDNLTWSSTTTGAYAIYKNDNANDSIYGKLYNWYAVDDPRHVCPSGWHVPSDTEWTTLTDYLGGLAVAGGKMKTTGLQYWMSPNTDATNESGFSGLPGGYRYNDGDLYIVGFNCYWWSSSEYDTYIDIAWRRYLNYSNGSAYQNTNNKRDGLSVRCLRD